VTHTWKERHLQFRLEILKKERVTSVAPPSHRGSGILEISLEVYGGLGIYVYGMVGAEIFECAGEASKSIDRVVCRPLESSVWRHSLAADHALLRPEFEVHRGLGEPFVDALRCGLTMGVEEFFPPNLHILVTDAAHDGVGTSELFMAALGYALVQIALIGIRMETPQAIETIVEVLSPFRKFVDAVSSKLQGGSAN
jgi:hypothetical protein